MASHIIQLSLARTPDARRAEALLALCDRLLSLVADQVPDAARLGAEAFRRRLEQWRHALQAETDPDRLGRLAGRIAAECEAFFERARGCLADRETELFDLVRVVRDVIEAVRGDAKQFEADLAASVQDLERVAGLDDIRELKRALVRQAEVIRQVIAERQVTEARHYEALTARLQTLERSMERARAEAATDALTGIPNRGAFDVALREWLARAAREGIGFTLAMIDLDDFKRINDTHGHPVGDRVLLAAAQLLTGALEGDEVAARYGGEEFALLLQSPSAGAARQRLEALLRQVPPAYEYDLAGEKRFLSFTFSAGVTDRAEGDTPESIVKRADEALYDAKRRGKRRVETRSRSRLRALIG